ncbi:MAG: nicotinamide riboside transporter PnuC, partial [Cyclobacteriaceae bacterium]|nr:nicotinamide riboside transporter PnuC [Cyclobacteriaceae bacterium HetDA_MAG_MS6]
GVNAYYFAMSVYGWYHWTDTKSEKKQIPITQCNWKEHFIAFSIMGISFLLIRFGLDFTDSDVPNLDAITTATAITGMWLMARKKVENWIYWIITDIIATPLYFYKGLIFFSFQFFVFTILATWGYFSWRKKL